MQDDSERLRELGLEAATESAGPEPLELQQAIAVAHDRGAESCSLDQTRDDSANRVGGLQAEAREAFLRDLPELLRRYRGQWVAYRSSQRLGLDGTKTTLLQSCYALGHDPREILVRWIQPGADEPPSFWERWTTEPEEV